MNEFKCYFCHKDVFKKKKDGTTEKHEIAEFNGQTARFHLACYKGKREDLHNKGCKKCGTEMVFSQLLECLMCPVCSPPKLYPAIMQVIINLQKKEEKKNARPERTLIRPALVKPRNAKNGDKYKDAKGQWFIFKFGSWQKFKVPEFEN